MLLKICLFCIIIGAVYGDNLEDYLVDNSPFTRRIDNLNEDLTATGIAIVNNKPIVTIYNTKTKESLVVTDQVNFDGWKLETIKQKYVVVSVRGEVVRVRFQSLK